MAIAGRYVKDLDENDLAAIQAAAEKSAAELRRSRPGLPVSSVMLWSVKL
jgi:hypothetical protein